MLDKLASLEASFEQIERRMSDPEVISDQSVYQDLVRRHAELEDGIVLVRQYRAVMKEIEESETLKQDPELKEMVEEELKQLVEKKSGLEESLLLFLLPRDPNDQKNAVVEIRAGTGGEEASLFAMDLYRMYVRYAESQQWKVEILSESMTGLGGVKEIAFSISGKGVYSRLKYESGTHRVQRVPETESQGRVHTSAVTVAILAEAEELDLAIDAKDLRIDTYRASGAGGQHVNKTDSAVRITHLPSGVVVACQDERSQFQNKEKAMRLLRTKLYEKLLEDQMKSESEQRKIQVGSGDRSQKIRTYNFPQKRVTDHRINLTLYDLDGILQGKMAPILDALSVADRMEKLKQSS